MHVLKVVSLNPSTIYCVDNFSHLYVNICKVFEKTKINEKEAGLAHFLIFISKPEPEMLLTILFQLSRRER